MLEVLIWSLFVGSLGIDAVLVGGWLRWQAIVKTQEEEEEEILSHHESEDQLTGAKISSMTSVRSPKGLNSSSSSSVHNHSRTQASRKSPQTAAKKIPEKAKQPNLSRSQPQAALHHFPPHPANIDQGSLTHSQNPVNSFHQSETIEKPMYFTETKRTEWEYKIVRSNSDIFRNPTNFTRLCEEESQAGWILLEKLDDRRVRFKRDVEMREQIDVNQLSFDPYRSEYGPSHGVINFLGAIAAVTAIVLPAYLGYTLVSHTLQESTTKNSQTKAPLDLISPKFKPPQIP